jgi:hypothetical protein
MKPRAVLWLALWLGACASYGPGDLRVGQTRAEVTQSLGPNTGQYTLADGSTRLEFARGPFGRHTWMVDLDASGRVAQWEQVLDEWHFQNVLPGQKQDEVLRAIGRPSERVGMMRNGQIWSWRYPNNDCLWFQASFNAEGVLLSAGYAPGWGTRSS